MASVSIDFTAAHKAATLHMFNGETETRLTHKVGGVDTPKKVKELTNKQLLAFVVERSLKSGLVELAAGDPAPLLNAKQARTNREDARAAEDAADAVAIEEAKIAMKGNPVLTTAL